jgi:hypothetical protein
MDLEKKDQIIMKIIIIILNLKKIRSKKYNNIKRTDIWDTKKNIKKSV